MPKSDILPLRRLPCWPGPYSRRLTGLFGRPQMFSPIRRSSLYLALWRFDICRLQYAVCRRISAVPGSHHMGIKAGSIPYATAASTGSGVHCEGARLAGEAIVGSEPLALEPT